MYINYVHEGDDFCKALTYRQTRKKANESNIEDVYDGKLYRNYISSAPPNTVAITFKHNTDGIAVFKSSGKDVWPIILEINELPPRMRLNINFGFTFIFTHNRIRVENMIIAGIWFGESHPVLNTFMKPLTESLKHLETSGTLYFHNHNISILIRYDCSYTN